jgi:hypothetical protein
MSHPRVMRHRSVFHLGQSPKTIAVARGVMAAKLDLDRRPASRKRVRLGTVAAVTLA